MGQCYKLLGYVYIGEVCWQNLSAIPDVFTSPSYLGFLGRYDTKRIMNCLYWRHLLAKPSVTATRDSHATVTTVLALTTLGGATQIGLFLFFVTPPKVAKASSHVAVTVAVACHCRWWYPAKLCRLKHSFSSFLCHITQSGQGNYIIRYLWVIIVAGMDIFAKKFANVCVALWNLEAVWKHACSC